MARWASARRAGGRVLPDDAQWLLQQARDEDRRQDVIHPSELSKRDFCERAVSLRLMGVPAPPEEISYNLENIFDEGHAIHEKHQRRWWARGVLFGEWKCEYCRHLWLAISPDGCPVCHAPRGCLTYEEVPLESPQHRIGGRSDGEVRDRHGNVLIELKSMSQGSLRTEAPQLLSANTYKVRDYLEREHTYQDIDTMWRELRAPLGSAGRQGQIYLALREMACRTTGWPPVDGIVYVYENKIQQRTKEFFVRPDAEAQKELLGTAADVVWAAERGKPMRCPKGRGGCAKCHPLEEAWARAGGQAERGRWPVGPDGPGGAEAGRATGSPSAAPPRRRAAAATGGHHLPRRRGADGHADEVHALGRLLDGAARPGRR